MALDYNRGLPAPVRWTHAGLAFAAQFLRPLMSWTFAPARRDWAPALVVGLPAFIILWPLDGPLSGLFGSLGKRLSGDASRELHAWQQYGAFGSLLFTAAVIWLLDRRRWRRLLDLALAATIAAIACAFLKSFIGRPRPKLGDPHTILGPLGEYPITAADGTIRLARAWSPGTGQSGVIAGGYDLWSMPSSHTAFAVLLSVFLAAVYPRLRPLAILLPILVGLSRILFEAHWPTDVIAGACLGYVITAPIVQGWWGVRALDWFWRFAIDRNAQPAFPSLIAETRVISDAERP